MNVLSKRLAPVFLGLWLAAVPASAFDDQDLDGVPSQLDRCPGTPMDELVDASGCPQRLGISLGIGFGYSTGEYGGSDTIESQSKDIRIGYNRGPWYVSISTSYLDSGVEDPSVDLNSSSGMGDTYVLGGYAMTGKAWSLMLQGLVKIPTADTDIGTGETDMGVYATLSTLQKGVGYFATLGYLVTGDTNTVKYNDIDSLTFGAGKTLNEAWYIALSATSSKALLKGVERSESVSAMLRYDFKRRWYASGNYTLGLSDSVADHALNAGIGYAF